MFVDKSLQLCTVLFFIHTQSTNLQFNHALKTSSTSPSISLLLLLLMDKSALRSIQRLWNPGRYRVEPREIYISLVEQVYMRCRNRSEFLLRMMYLGLNFSRLLLVIRHEIVPFLSLNQCNIKDFDNALALPQEQGYCETHCAANPADKSVACVQTIPKEKV